MINAFVETIFVVAVKVDAAATYREIFIAENSFNSVQLMPDAQMVTLASASLPSAWDRVDANGEARSSHFKPLGADLGIVEASGTRSATAPRLHICPSYPPLDQGSVL